MAFVGNGERLALAVHPTFRRILAESRQRCKPGQGISTAELRRRLKRRRAANPPPRASSGTTVSSLEAPLSDEGQDGGRAGQR
jgi:hypothetical protein